MPGVGALSFFGFWLSMKIVLSWNVRGARARYFPSLVHDICSRYRVDVFVLLEPRISGTTADRVIRQMGFQHNVRVDVVGFCGGIWLLHNDLDQAVDVVCMSSQFIHLILTSKTDGNFWYLTCVYASPRLAERSELWDSLRTIANQIGLNSWAGIGDFNSYLSVEDKTSGGLPNFISIRGFQDYVQDCLLLDIGFNGLRYTWEGRGVRERLDSVVYNGAWSTLFTEASLLHLPALKSDHQPILLSLSPSQAGHPRHYQFKFMVNWLLDKTFPDVVKEAWQENLDWKEAIGIF